LISAKEDTKAAAELVKACGVWSTTLREAVLVFQGGYWDTDHHLWEAIQKVGLIRLVVTPNLVALRSGPLITLFPVILPPPSISSIPYRLSDT
jgi:hypothetical protein